MENTNSLYDSVSGSHFGGRELVYRRNKKLMFNGRQRTLTELTPDDDDYGTY